MLFFEIKKVQKLVNVASHKGSLLILETKNMFWVSGFRFVGFVVNYFLRKENLRFLMNLKTIVT